MGQSANAHVAVLRVRVARYRLQYHRAQEPGIPASMTSAAHSQSASLLGCPSVYLHAGPRRSQLRFRHTLIAYLRIGQAATGR